MADTADLSQLPRLYVAAAFCTLPGRPETAVGYARRAVDLDAAGRYDSFPTGWSRLGESMGHAYAGRVDRALDILTEVAAEPGPTHILAQVISIWLLTGVGRDEDARMIAEKTVAAARAHGNPWYIAMALANGFGRALSLTDPGRALDAYREALVYCRDHRLLYAEEYIAYSAAGLEASHGDADRALELFDFAIDTCHRAGDHPNLELALGSLAVHFHRVGQPEIASRIYGASTHSGSIAVVPGLPDTLLQLRAELGPTVFDDLVAHGAALVVGDAVAYARQQIRLARLAIKPT